MLLVGNGHLFTRDSDNPYIKDGCVAIDDNIIIEIGTTSDLKDKYPTAPFVDAQNQLIMPGLINTHHHIYSALARGLYLNHYNPKNFLDILEGLWWKLDKHLTIEDIRYSAYVTYIACIKCGVTTVFDHHASFGSVSDSLFQIGNIADELGIKSSLCFEISDRHGEEAMKKSVRENIEFMEYCKNSNSSTLSGMVGLHASFTVSDETLDFLASVNTLPEAGYHIHVAEDKSDVLHSLKHYHKPIVNRLDDVGLLGPKTLAVHCIHINEDEMNLIKEKDAIIIHNPESNMGNAVGCSPISDFAEKGILLGLGTDGYTSNMLESLKVANIIHKHENKNPTSVSSLVPTMLFHNNPLIANRFFKNKVGKLTEGYAADLIVVNYNPPTPLDANNLDGHMLFGLNGNEVTTTIVNGKVVMDKGIILNIDEEAIMAHSRETASKLWERIHNN